MKNDKTYNGWSNYETWLCNVWLDNDGHLDLWRQRAVERLNKALPDAVFTREEKVAYELSQDMRAEYEELLPAIDGLAGDLLRAAFGEINFREIATTIIGGTTVEEQGTFKAKTKLVTWVYPTSPHAEQFGLDGGGYIVSTRAAIGVGETALKGFANEKEAYDFAETLELAWDKYDMHAYAATLQYNKMHTTHDGEENDHE